MKFALTIILVYIVSFFILFSQDSLTRKTKTGQFTLKYFLHSPKANYLKFSGDSGCFQMFNDSIFFSADERVVFYKGWDFSKYTNLSIGTLINDMNKHFILINYKISKLHNHKKVFSLTYNYYKDTNTYYELNICLGYHSMFESKEESSDIKSAFAIKDYSAHIEVWSIDYKIESEISFYHSMRPEKGSKREKHHFTRIKEAKELKKKIDKITVQIQKGKIVLPSGDGKQE